MTTKEIKELAASYAVQERLIGPEKTFEAHKDDVLYIALLHFYIRKVRRDTPHGIWVSQPRTSRRSSHKSLWYPLPTETRECCRNTRPPSLAYPWSYYRHCYSVVHMANLHNVDPRILKGLVKEYNKLKDISQIKEWCRREISRELYILHHAFGKTKPRKKYTRRLRHADCAVCS
jgi:hypothetical protein